MQPKRKGPSVRGGQPLDASRLGRGDASSNAGNRLPTQDIKPFGSKLSTGAQRAPFSRRQRQVVAKFLPPKFSKVQAVEKKRLCGDEARQDAALPTYVIDPALQTACSWGISPDEAKRAGAWCQHVEQAFLSSGDYVVLFLVVAAGHLDDAAKLQVRRDMLRVVGKVQARAGMAEPVWLEVREGAGGLHFNVLLVLPAAMVDVVDIEFRQRNDGTWREVWRVSSPLDAALTGNATLGVSQPERFAKHNRLAVNGKNGALFDLQQVHPGELVNVVRYCLKETSTQAHAAMHKAFKREPGSHRLEVGGDRVRMAACIEATLLRAGKIKVRRKAYAKARLGMTTNQSDNERHADRREEGPELSIGVEIADRAENGGRNGSEGGEGGHGGAPVLTAGLAATVSEYEDGENFLTAPSIVSPRRTPDTPQRCKRRAKKGVLPPPGTSCGHGAPKPQGRLGKLSTKTETFYENFRLPSM